MTGHDAGRIVLLGDADPVRLVAAIHEVRAHGGIPLVGDERWSDSYRLGVQQAIASADPVPEAAWATLTSGSTGVPRIVLRTHESWSSSFAPVAALLGAERDDVLYLPSPPVSSLSLFSIAHAAAAGFALALPHTRAVSAHDFATATLLHGTPRALRSVVEILEADAGVRRRNRLRAALVGGSDLDPGLRERAERLGLRVASYYGAAELSFVAADRGDGLRAFAGVELAIREGELWVRSPYRALGYLRSDQRQAMRVDAQGWATVGDLAELGDADPAAPGPLLTLRGRRDGAILSASATVVPGDVEAVLRALPGVLDAVVLGVPNAGVGELVAAVIETPADGTAPTAAALRQRVADSLTPSHRPRLWFGMPELPRTATGKPARSELRRRVLAGEVGSLD
jgi:long-chain acyl-CoA synthetase